MSAIMFADSTAEIFTKLKAMCEKRASIAEEYADSQENYSYYKGKVSAFQELAQFFGNLEVRKYSDPQGSDFRNKNDG